jgi:hypothetical protein
VISRLLTCALLIGAVPLGAQQRLVRAMAAEPNVAIRLWVPAGFVEVQGWDHDSVDVRVTPAPGTTLSGGGTRAASKFSLETNLGDSVLASATMRVKVPRGARVWIKSTTASVSVQGVRGELDVLQVDGAITMRDLRGVIRAESIDGTISLVRADGVTRIRSGAGAIGVGAIRGRLDVSSISGDITLTGVIREAELASELHADIETVGGRVMLIGGLPNAGSLTIATHDGTVDLVLHRASVPRVEASGGTLRIAAGLETSSGKVGVVTVRTFKGTVNASITGGI